MRFGRRPMVAPTTTLGIYDKTNAPEPANANSDATIYNYYLLLLAVVFSVGLKGIILAGENRVKHDTRD